MNGTNNLFSTILPLPDDAIGTDVFRWINASQQLGDAIRYLGGGMWIDGNGNDPAPLNPGEGVFIKPLSAGGNPTLNVTFVGEVLEGSLSTPLAGANLTSFKASQVPQEQPLGGPGVPGMLEFPFDSGDLASLYDPNTAFSQSYTSLGSGDAVRRRWLFDYYGSGHPGRAGIQSATGKFDYDGLDQDLCRFVPFGPTLGDQAAG